MTREGAIKAFEEIKASAQNNLGAKHAAGCEGYYRTRIELAEAALRALRPASREQVEKAWGAKWIDAHPRTRSCKCTRCNSVQEFETDFCSSCGASMTDEAVEMVMERLNELNNEEEN